MLDLASLHRRASRVLPAALQTSGLLLREATSARIARLLLPLGHVRRGSLRFVLAGATVERVARSPIACLQQARQPRDPARPGYGPWQAYGQGPGLRYVSQRLDGHAALCLLPARRLLVYAWDDRRVLLRLDRD